MNMMEADEINAAHQEGRSGVQGGAGQGHRRARARSRARRKVHQAMVAECTAARDSARRRDGQQGRDRDLPAHRQGPRHRGGARRRRTLHGLPGPAAAGGVRGSPQERSIVQCDSCNRILYFIPPKPGAPAAPRHPTHPPVITAFFDGGARSNPGPAGYGVYIVDDPGHGARRAARLARHRDQQRR